MARNPAEVSTITTGDPLITVQKEDSIVVITIDNPPMNVLCTPLLEELDKALDEISADKDLRAMILTGNGRAFVAGADIKEMSEMDIEGAKRFATIGQSVLNKMEALSIPVIAAVNGFALGGGTEIAMACDIRIASTAAKFGQPEVSLGLIPGFGGTQRLPRLIGPGKAKELIYTGDMIGAEEALSIGLVQQVVEGYKVDENGEKVKNEKGKPISDNAPVLEASMKMAGKIASKGPIAITNSKRSINEGLNMPLREGLKLEAGMFTELFSTHDREEGLSAFVEKRKAEFKGK